MQLPVAKQDSAKKMSLFIFIVSLIIPVFYKPAIASDFAKWEWARAYVRMTVNQNKLYKKPTKPLSIADVYSWFYYKDETLTLIQTKCGKIKSEFEKAKNSFLETSARLETIRKADIGSYADLPLIIAAGKVEGLRGFLNYADPSDYYAFFNEAYAYKESL